MLNGIDETITKVGQEHIWVWVAIEAKDKEIVEINISK
jgi:transposase-like protein